jgi:hypothetical protein
MPAMPDTAASDAVVDGVNVDAVAIAVRGCPGVYDLHGGPPQLTATYLPGRRVEGVRIDPLAVAVQVRARWGVSVSELSRQIRAALAPVAAGRRIDIIWADVADGPVPASEGSWTRTNAGAGRADENSSVPTTPTVAATRPPSSPAWRTSTGYDGQATATLIVSG